MKRLLLICLITVTLTACSMTPKTKSAYEAADQSSGLRTVVGCLSRTGDTYVITGGAPGPKQFRIVSGDVSALRGELGHTVEVVGVIGKNDALANQNGIYNEGSTTGVGYFTIDLQKTKRLYGNCSEPGKEWSGDRMQ